MSSFFVHDWTISSMFSAELRYVVNFTPFSRINLAISMLPIHETKRFMTLLKRLDMDWYAYELRMSDRSSFRFFGSGGRGNASDDNIPAH